MCHMKTITIRQLHDATGRWVRQAAQSGDLHVTERGRIIAKISPANPTPDTPFFARRKLLPGFQATRRTGGPDATLLVSSERDERP
jgi:antitoxin (DNA-binding transcriptional repressor) of toxin-antitoxin stability system